MEATHAYITQDREIPWKWWSLMGGLFSEISFLFSMSSCMMDMEATWRMTLAWGDVKVAGSSMMEHHISEHQRYLCGGLIQDGGLNFGWVFPRILMHAWFLDGLDGDGRYLVDDMIIYHNGRLFLARDSSLKEKLLHAACEDFLAIHLGA